MSLYSANRFKNLCPEYVAEAVEQQLSDVKVSEEDKKNNVQQVTTPGKEGGSDGAPSQSNVVEPKEEGFIDGVKNFFSNLTGGNNNSTTTAPSADSSTTSDFGEKPTDIKSVGTGDEKISMTGTFTDNGVKPNASSVNNNGDAIGVAVSFEAADVTETEEVDVSIVDEAAYIDYLLESLDSEE